MPSRKPQLANMSPAPPLVQAALDHCEIPIVYNDDDTIKLQPCGWEGDSMVIGDELQAILASVLTVAMVKHVEDTFVLPSNVARIREQIDMLCNLGEYAHLDAEEYETLNDVVDTLGRVADNLDPEKR